MPNFKPLPSRKLLLEAFSYCPDTGLLLRKNSGKPATSLSTSGYLKTNYKNRYYYVHRLVWKLQTGEDPTNIIDHKNGIKTDNRWENLRDVSFRQNQGNRVMPSRTLPRGVYQVGKRFQAKCCQISLGWFSTPEAAHARYVEEHIKVFGKASFFARTAQ